MPPSARRALDFAAAATPEPDSFEKIREHSPIGPLGQPEDVAKAVPLLCCEEVLFITGATGQDPLPSDRRVPVTALSMFVNSIGKTNFVDGLCPRTLSVSKYWRPIVFASTPRATS